MQIAWITFDYPPIVELKKRHRQITLLERIGGMTWLKKTAVANLFAGFSFKVLV